MKLKAFVLATTRLAASSAAQGVTVEYWTILTQSDRLQTIELMADVFEALNPEIDVKVVSVDENDISKQIAAAAAANTLPNMIEADSNFSVAFAKQGIIDLEATTEVVDQIGGDRFYNGGTEDG